MTMQVRCSGTARGIQPASMSSRERIMAALHGQPVDRVPFIPHVGGYSMASLPTRYQEMTRWQFLREIGADLFIRAKRGFASWPPDSYAPPSTMVPLAWQPAGLQAPPLKGRSDDRVQVSRVRRGHETLVTLETPVGRLRSLWRQTPESPLVPFPAEPLLKTVEDLKVFQYALERAVVEPWYEDLVAAKAAVQGEGVVEAVGNCTPIQDLIMWHIGLEQTVFMLLDHPAEIQALIDMMQEVRKKEYRVLAQSPADLVVTYENTSTTLLSPAYMARYESPALAEYSDILHQGGKPHLVHMCGKIQGVLDLISQALFDGITDVAPPPTGNCDFRVAREQLNSAGKCLTGGIDATAFVQLTPDEMQAYVLNRLREVAPGTGFLLGSGDAVPFGTSLENLRAAAETAHTYGTYPISV
jgi:uroporphyrinogen-III decarboxylase